jgi:hypothetical protein
VRASGATQLLQRGRRNSIASGAFSAPMLGDQLVGQILVLGRQIQECLPARRIGLFLRRFPHLLREQPVMLGTRHLFREAPA